MKDFDTWNKEKKAIDALERTKTIFVHEREVWWCALGVNIGVETDGKHENFERPMLVIKTFNTDMFWALPLTSHPRSGKYYKTVRHPGGASSVFLSQIRTISTKRLIRKVGMIAEDDFSTIRRELQKYLAI